MRRCLAMALLVLLVPPAAAQAKRTLLVSADTPGVVNAYDVARDGTPTAFAGGPVSSGAGANGIAVSPDARFAFVANISDDTVRPFVIGDGTLTPVSGAVSTGGNQPTALTLTPDGRRLLVAHRSGQDVSVFDVNQGTGALTPAGLAQDVGVGLDDVTSIAVSRDGRVVYVAGRGPSGPPASNADTRLGFLTLGPTGTLTPIGGSPTQFAGVFGAFGLTISPDGGRLYLTLTTASSIRAFSLNQTTGVPSALAGSPFAAGAATQQGILSQDGSRLYALDVFGNSVPGYGLSAAGAPSPIAGSPFTVGALNQPQGVAVAPDGRTLYASIAKDPALVAGFAVGATGALTPLPGSPFTGSGGFPDFYSVAITPTQTPDVALAAETGTVAGGTTTLTANATVRGGFATRYDWDFGDGSALADGPAAAAHSYAQPGSYTARVTVTNDCDPAATFVDGSVFVGRVTYCHGPRTATAEHTVVVSASSPPALAPPDTGTPTAFTAGRAFTLPSAKRCLKRPAKLTLTFRRPTGVTVDRVEVLLGKRRLARRSGAAARRSLTLRKLPSKTFTLTLKVTPRGGKTVSVKRTYRVCPKPVRP